MTCPEPADDLRDSLRDLLPDYRGPADPLAGVEAAVRRRRVRRQGWLAVASTAGAAAILACLPTALGLTQLTAGPAPRESLVAGPDRAGAAVPGSVVADGSAHSGATSADGQGWPEPPLRGYRVASAEIGRTRWTFSSTSISTSARRCLYANDALFVRTLVCFDYWRPGAATTWTVIESHQPKQLGASAVVGVAPARAASVVVLFSDGRPHRARAVRTGTDSTVRFFAVVWPATGLKIYSVTALDSAGRALHHPATDPHGRACEPQINLYCGKPSS